METTLLQTGFSTRAIHMRPFWKLSFQAPVEDIDRIFERIAEITPLAQGKTDKNGYRSATGYEYYRPREGTPTGAEDELRRRPGADEMSIFIPREQALLEQIIDAIYEVHCYYEPLIFVADVLRSETVGLDDSDNPHRWWNKDGDWKTSG